MNKQATAIRWCRVSSDEQRREGYSLDEQDRITREFCEREGFKVVGAFLNVSESGWGKEPRPRFNEMLALARRLKADHIVAAKFDRVARNVADFDLAWHACPGTSMTNGLLSVTEPVPRGAAGRLLAGVLSNFAEFSSNQSSERIQGAMAVKAADGVPPGPVPFGYRHMRQNGRDVVVQQEGEIDIYRQLVKEARTGRKTLDELAIYLRDVGGPALSRAGLHRLLTSRFFAGYFQWAGKTWRGGYPAGITMRDFDALQRAIRRGESDSRYRKHHHTYRGLIICGHCEKPLTSGVTKGHVYCWCHRCRIKGRYLREDSAAEALAGAVQAIAVDERWAASTLRALRSASESRTAQMRRRKGALEKRLTDARRRLDAALDLRLDGRLDDDVFLRRSGDWEEEIARTTHELAALQGGNGAQADTLSKIFELSQDASELYLTRSPEKKRALLDIVLLNARWDGVTLAPTYRSPFDVLAERASVLYGRGDWI